MHVGLYNKCFLLKIYSKSIIGVIRALALDQFPKISIYLSVSLYAKTCQKHVSFMLILRHFSGSVHSVGIHKYVK